MYTTLKLCLNNSNIIIIVILISIEQVLSLQSQIKLQQGTLAGIKVIPNSGRSGVYCFLGVPYAESPIGTQRFAAPKIHSGWKGTLYARKMKPLCPQPTDTVYDETPSGETTLNSAHSIETNEDCLYLNIWVSESSLRYGNQPILIILTGEEMLYDWNLNRITGVDIATEGLVVISIQYRTNIFGWIGLSSNSDIKGNYGLLDQAMAFQWIKANIQYFGGNSENATLLGHGTSGAPCALLHLLQKSSSSLIFNVMKFQRVILMSGGNYKKTLNSRALIHSTSTLIIRKLGCQFEKYDTGIVACLRSKSVTDLLNAFSSIYDNGNSSYYLGPIVDFNQKAPLRNLTHLADMPTIIIGITSNEGAFMQEYWWNLARNGAEALRIYINNTILRKVITQQQMDNSIILDKHTLDLLNWHYFNWRVDENITHLLVLIQQILTEFEFEIPFYWILDMLSKEIMLNKNFTVFAYVFHINNSIDMRGIVNKFHGASHSSDLPILLGPSLFQQISRRRFNTHEDSISLKMKSILLKSLPPIHESILSNEQHVKWLPITTEVMFIYNLGDQPSSFKATYFKEENPLLKSSYVSNNSPTSQSLESKLKNAAIMKNTGDFDDYTNHLKYVYGFWQLLCSIREDSINSSKEQITIQKILYTEMTAKAMRFKHGFFLMLIVVIMLLCLLCICIHVIKHTVVISANPMKTSKIRL